MALGKTVGELLTVITSEELTEWAAYDRMEPFGLIRGDLHAAMVAHVIANVNAKKGHSFKISDFLLSFDKQEPQVMSGEQILAAFRKKPTER